VTVYSTIIIIIIIIIAIFIHLSANNSTNIFLKTVAIGYQKTVAIGYQRSHLAHL